MVGARGHDFSRSAGVEEEWRYCARRQLGRLQARGAAEALRRSDQWSQRLGHVSQALEVVPRSAVLQVCGVFGFRSA